MADIASLSHMKPKSKKEKERISRVLSSHAVANTWWDPSSLTNWMTEECLCSQNSTSPQNQGRVFRISKCAWISGTESYIRMNGPDSVSSLIFKQLKQNAEITEPLPTGPKHTSDQMAPSPTGSGLKTLSTGLRQVLEVGPYGKFHLTDERKQRKR
jgi:hypothetical protein